MDGHGHNADLLHGGPRRRGGPTISVNVFDNNARLCLVVPAHSTFGELKKRIHLECGLVPDKQRLLFEGIERDDQEYLDRVGVNDNASVTLKKEKKEKRTFEEAEGSRLSSAAEVRREKESGSVELTVEDPLEKENRLKELTYCAAIAKVRAEDDKLSEQVAALKGVVNGGTQAGEKEILNLTELLMKQLLKLDGIKAVGEMKEQRKLEVTRVQSLIDTLDSLKGMKSNPLSNESRNV